MSHNLNINNGRVSFVSKKEVPWHKLGTIVDTMDSREAMVLGGLDFEVEKRPLIVQNPIGIDFIEAKEYNNISRILTKEGGVYYKNIEIPGQFATVRTDNNFPLGIVGSKYHVIQNIEAFEFIDSIIGEGVADYETAGCLNNGEVVFITCKVKEELLINKDLIDNYLLISMAHDGSASITVMFTPIRVVCNNTLSVALRGKQNKVVIRHTKNAKDKLEQAKKVLGLIDVELELYKELFGRLSHTYISDEKAYKIIEQSFGLVRDDKNRLSTKAENILRNSKRYYHTGLGQEEIVGTAYGVYNGITGYLQNVKNYSTDDSKFKSTFAGSGSSVRNKALDLLLNI